MSSPCAGLLHASGQVPRGLALAVAQAKAPPVLPVSVGTAFAAVSQISTHHINLFAEAEAASLF